MSAADPIADLLPGELRAILEMSPVGIVLLERDGHIRSINGRAGEMLGVDPSSVAGRHLLEFLVGDDLERYAAALDYGTGYTNGTMGPLRIRYRRPDGEVYESDAWSYNALEHPDVRAFVVICTPETAANGFSRALAAIAEGRSVETTLTELARALRGHPFASKGCWVVDDGGRRLVGMETLSPLTRRLLADDGPWWDELGGSQPFSIDDVRAHEQATVRGLASAGVRALWWVPVVGSENAPRQAAAIVLRDLPEAPSPNQVEHLARMADIAAIAFDRQSMRRRLAAAAYRDDLTGIANRKQFFEWHSGGLAANTALFYVDIDHFKSINDTYGHAAGDGVLLALASRLETTLRPSDNVARLGGDEFVAVCADVSDAELSIIARRIVDAAREALPTDRPGRFTVSVGVAMSSGLAPTSDVLDAADRALYVAKEAGRDRFAIAPR